MSDTASIFQYQPQILRETCEGIQRLDLRDQMLANREVELCGPVDAGSCAVLIRSLLHLQQEDAQAPIRMFINSPGGEVQSGLALYDVMQALNCPVNTICLGMAASMAALIFVSGARREMLPHSRIMIHDPLIGGGIGGSALSVKARADDLMRIRDITGEVHSRHHRRGAFASYRHAARPRFRTHGARHLFRGRRCHRGGSCRRRDRFVLVSLPHVLTPSHWKGALS